MRKNTLRFSLLLAALATTILVVGSSFFASKTAPCEESMESCCLKKEPSPTMSMETLTDQFFSFAGQN